MNTAQTMASKCAFSAACCLRLSFKMHSECGTFVVCHMEYFLHAIWPAIGGRGKLFLASESNLTRGKKEWCSMISMRIWSRRHGTTSEFKALWVRRANAFQMPRRDSSVSLASSSIIPSQPLLDACSAHWGPLQLPWTEVHQVWIRSKKGVSWNYKNAFHFLRYTVINVSGKKSRRLCLQNPTCYPGCTIRSSIYPFQRWSEPKKTGASGAELEGQRLPSDGARLVDSGNIRAKTPLKSTV